MCFNGFDPEMVWSENFHFKPFPDSCAKTERERERAQSLDRAPIRRPQQRTPQTELQSNNHRLSSSLTTHTPLVSSIASPCWSHQCRRSQHRANRTAPFKQRSTPTPLDLAFTSAARSYLLIKPSRLSLFLLLSIWWDLMNFFSRFCFFCVSVLTEFDEVFFWVLFLLYFCIDRIWWIFFLSFVSFVFLYWGMILYICLAVEKMWENVSNK